VVPLFSSLKKEHVKTALLSDFPPGVKPKALKISEFVDITLCAEDTGRLKPDPTPFEVLTEQLRVSDPAGILYVGNSYDKDIIGAKGAGLRTAYIVRSRKRAEDPGFIREHEKADIIFSNYRQLSRIIDSMERAGISW
jgi:putative hydrolase of the HAD superfamily